MSRRFSDVLEEYLEERDRQNSDYYENRFYLSQTQGRDRMQALAKEMNEMVEGVNE